MGVRSRFREYGEAIGIDRELMHCERRWQNSLLRYAHKKHRKTWMNIGHISAVGCADTTAVDIS
eukprot:1567608-Ditylum_brightwellii.AAC.1